MKRTGTYLRVPEERTGIFPQNPGEEDRDIIKENLGRRTGIIVLERKDIAFFNLGEKDNVDRRAERGRIENEVSINKRRRSLKIL